MTFNSSHTLTSGVNLIGLSGHAGSGKDTASDFLCDTYKNYYYESFAAPLKDAASAAFGISREDFDSHELKEVSNELWNVSPRQVAQFIGTEMFRATLSKLLPYIGEDFWVKRLHLRLNNDFTPPDVGAYEFGDTVIITDVRFQNEYDFIMANGGSVIHLTRLGADGNIGIPNHASESSYNKHTPERTYLCENNGTVKELYKKLADIISAMKY
jgi:hypothetical protein